MFDLPGFELPMSERRAARWILLALLALITLPYLFAPFLLPQERVWGGLLGSADDQNVHLMWARQAQNGQLFFRDLFAVEGLKSDEKPLFFNVLPAVIGVLSRLTTLDGVFFYHALRVALAAFALWQFHLLALCVTQNEPKWSRARLIALFLLALTTGAAFLAPLLGFSRFVFIDSPTGNFPLMPEAFFLLSAFAYPLNIASFGLLALLFRLVLEKKGAPAAFVAALLLANIHTYDALPLVLTLLLWTIWKRDWKVSAAAILGALIPVGYQILVFRGSEEFRLKALTVTAPPDALSMLISLAPLWILGLFGVKKWRELPATRLLLVWIAATFALVYAPTALFSFARKMIEGVQMPLVLLAAIGASELLSKIQNSGARKLAAASFGVVLMLSPALFFAWIAGNTLENNASRWNVLMPPLAISRGDAGALQWLAAQNGRGAVLCLPYLGSYVPRATGKFTYAGHWAETLRFKEEKFPLAARFYRGEMNAETARQFLRENRIVWIVEGEFERALAPNASMAQKLGLLPVWSGGDAQNGVTTVYRAP